MHISSCFLNFSLLMRAWYIAPYLPNSIRLYMEDKKKKIEDYHETNRKESLPFLIFGNIFTDISWYRQLLLPLKIYLYLYHTRNPKLTQYIRKNLMQNISTKYFNIFALAWFFLRFFSFFLVVEFCSIFTDKSWIRRLHES